MQLDDHEYDMLAAKADYMEMRCSDLEEDLQAMCRARDELEIRCRALEARIDREYANRKVRPVQDGLSDGAMHWALVRIQAKCIRSINDPNEAVVDILQIANDVLSGATPEDPPSPAGDKLVTARIG